jgi:hypothetical protein
MVLSVYQAIIPMIATEIKIVGMVRSAKGDAVSPQMVVSQMRILLVQEITHVIPVIV